MTHHTEQTSDGFHLWLTTEMYVPLDRDGYVSNDVPCLEGSMGYVIQTFNRDDPSVRYAWKIPRLLGDSLTENQYVCQLLIAEERHAIRMQNSPGVLAGLGPAGNPFERPMPGIYARATPPSRGVVARHYLLVQFGKGKRPRFCTVTFDGDALTVRPGSALLHTDERPTLAAELRNSLENRVYAQYIHEHCEAGTDDLHISALIDVSDSEQIKGGWYLKLPSVLYNWAGGTLQEAISEARRVGWTPRENLLLIQRILTGIRELHLKKLLHGDMRPANIMYTRDPADPEDYVLTDYGSLAGGDADRFGSSSEDATNDRTLFQAITNPRSSQFYAPERRQGYEHEEGDVVLLVPVLSAGLKSPAESLRTPDLKGWLLVVGWRNAIDALKISLPEAEVVAVSGRRSSRALPAPATTAQAPRPPGEGRPVAAEDTPRVEFEQGALGMLLRFLAQSFAANPPRAVKPAIEREMRLQPGDRVRFREYVFRVRSVDEREIRIKNADGPASTKLTVMYCDPEFWKVFTERLIIVVTDPAREFPFKGRFYEELSFPKMVELYRWSQATDIFAVGALALYSMFPRKVQRSSREIEQEFSNLLEILENPLFFRKIWPDLDSTCRKLEDIVADERRGGRAPSTFADVKVQVTQASRGLRSESPQNIETVSIKGLVRDTATSLVLTAPHAYEMLRETFGGNVALFCVFMRFVLACLHRRTSCSKDWDLTQVRTPYCADRIESTAVQIAADKAIADLRALLPLLTDERIQCLTLDDRECSEMPQFVDQGKADTIMQNLNLIRDLTLKERECTKWQAMAHALQQKVEDNDNCGVDVDFIRGKLMRLIESARRTVELLEKQRSSLLDTPPPRLGRVFISDSIRRQVEHVSSTLQVHSNELQGECARLNELIRLAST